MNEQSIKNKTAWEYRAYEFWCKEHSPKEKAEYIKENPADRIRKNLNHPKYFSDVKGLKIANICGSNGVKAIALALLGADVTVFDISEENKRYALETADFAQVKLEYEVGDFCDVDLEKYSSYFDMLYLEGGILHYFHDIDKLMKKLFEITKPGGKMVLSDFHPYRKVNPLGLKIATSMSASQTEGDYFDSGIHKGDLAYKSFFSEEEQGFFPDCQLRLYNLSEILNSLINAGFTLKEFNEHKNWTNPKLPGEFTCFCLR